MFILATVFVMLPLLIFIINEWYRFFLNNKIVNESVNIELLLTVELVFEGNTSSMMTSTCT